MQEQYALDSKILEIDDDFIFSSYLKPTRPRADGLTTIIMHGAGTANSDRHAGFAAAFAKQGVAVVSLDFLGHGKSSGTVNDNSLALRTRHALAVIEHWTVPHTPLLLCGFSMSGYTAARLTAVLGDQVRSIGLFCPATYAAEAEDISFGPDFTKILHTPNSWHTSLALEDLRYFPGRSLVVVGSEDDIIPWEIIEQTVYALKQKSSAVRLEVLPGVEHKLAGWFSEHTAVSTMVIKYLLGEEDSFQ